MEKKVIQERRANLQSGLASLTQQSVEILKQIEVQKGAISECDWWLKEIEEAKAASKKEPAKKLEPVKNEK
jgi:hypothetical protein